MSDKCAGSPYLQVSVVSYVLQVRFFNYTVYLVLRMRRVLRHLLDVCPKLNARGRMVTVRARDKE